MAADSAEWAWANPGVGDRFCLPVGVTLPPPPLRAPLLRRPALPPVLAAADRPPTRLNGDAVAGTAAPFSSAHAGGGRLAGRVRFAIAHSRCHRSATVLSVVAAPRNTNLTRPENGSRSYSMSGCRPGGREEPNRRRRSGESCARVSGRGEPPGPVLLAGLRPRPRRLCPCDALPRRLPVSFRWSRIVSCGMPPRELVGAHDDCIVTGAHARGAC